MAVPKRKTTQSKRNMRRSHDHLTVTNVSKCPTCDEPKRNHYACQNCRDSEAKKD